LALSRQLTTLVSAITKLNMREARMKTGAICPATDALVKEG